MNEALIPAVTAALGGSALGGGILIHKYRAERAMLASRVLLALRFPETDALHAKAALSGISGLTDRVELVFETAASQGEIRHYLLVPASVRESVVSILCGAMPGLRVTDAPQRDRGRVTLALKIFAPTPLVMTQSNPEAAVRTMLAGIGGLIGEEVSVKWAVRPGSPAPLRLQEPLDRAAREKERLWKQKTAMPGAYMNGLVLVRVGSLSRARELAEHVASSLRSRRGPVGALRITSERAGRSMSSTPSVTRSSGWVNVDEALSLISWPITGDELIPGVPAALTRQVPPRQELARVGRPLFIAEHRGEPRPVALTREAATRHVAVLGASGGGKSTLLAAGILSHIAAGDGGVVIDPKGDLVSTVIERADKGAERIVVLDPSAQVVPGVDLFAGGDPDLRAEVLLSIFRSLFKDAWGPRIDSYLALTLKTLAAIPGSSLLDLPQLLLDARARRRAIGFLRDPLLIGQWQMFDSLSEAERMTHIQAPLSRVLSLITRPPVQAVFGPDPRLDVAQLLRDRGWLLVPLSSGTIGSASARIIGSALTFIAWSHISSRAAIRPEQRRPLFLFFDELQALTDQGIGLEDLLEQSRGYGASVTVATQAIGRTPEQIRHSLLSNVGTLISLRSGADESTRIAKELPGLTARDIQSLPPYEVVARVAAGGGSGSIVVTGRTQPLGAPTGQAEAIRERSAQRFGRSREEIQAAIRERYGMTAIDNDAGIDLGRTGRQT